MNRIARVLAVLACLVLALTTAACRDETSADDKTLRVLLDTMPTNLDPQLADTDETRLIVRSCFEGLFRIEEGQVRPAACESYQVSKDGLTYTFTLRKGLAWSDGEPLTAADFRFGLVRALRPETKAPEADRLSAVDGASAMLAGQAGEESLGLEVRDKRTLVIRLATPDEHLLEALSYAMAMPCREDVFTAAAGRYGMDDDLIVCNGPLALSQWGDTSFRLKRNEHYVGDFASRPAAITLSFGATDAERVDAITDGLADLAVLRAQSAGIAENARVTLYRHVDTTWVVWLRPGAATLGDAAVAAALKRTLSADLAADALPAGFTPSGRLLADDLRVGFARSGAVIPAPASAVADPEGAQAALVAALKPYKGVLPTLTLYYADEDGLKPVASRLAQEWQRALGAVVNIESKPTADLVAAVDKGNVDLALCPLTAPDGQAASALRRLAGWLGAGADALAAYDAAAALDDAAQAQKLAELEVGLLADSHLIPIAQSGRCLAAADGVVGVDFDLRQGLMPLYTLGRY